MRTKSIRLLISIITFSILVIYTGCGKNGDGNLITDPSSEIITDTTSIVDPESKILSFMAFGIPVNKTIYLQQIAINNDEMTLAIKVKGGINVDGAVLQITYDINKLKYMSYKEGRYLGESEDIIFLEPFLSINGQEGRLHISVSKKGNVPGTNGDGILATIVLKALTGQINTAIEFDVTISNLLSATTNNPISGTTWLGGSLTYQ